MPPVTDAGGSRTMKGADMTDRWAVIYYDGIEYFPTRAEAFKFARQSVDDAKGDDGEWEDYAEDVRVAEIHAGAKFREVGDGFVTVEFEG